MSDELLLDFGDDATPQNLFDCPGPGIYRSSQVSFETYLGWRAVNSGVIKWGMITPKHFAAAFDGRLKSEDTKDRKLGRAIHCRLLEPDSFDDRYIVAGPCESVLKTGANKGKACGAPGKFLVDNYWLCGKHGDAPAVADGKEVVTQDELRRTLGVVDSLKTLPEEIRAMLSRPGWNEASIVWEHKGLKLKGRMDRYSDGKRPCILDVKKMQVGAGVREKCQKTILNYGYHVQAAIYVKGVESLTGKRPEFLWVFVEDNDPFDIQVVPATDEDIDIGWRACELAIRAYQESVPDHWGYIRIVENVHPGGLPPWFIQSEREKYAGI
jgi:exodeoxyribonuclease VIII